MSIIDDVDEAITMIPMLERNPAPGTEGDAPRRSRYDLRTGEFKVIR